jgi:beta-mannosidase
MPILSLNGNWSLYTFLEGMYTPQNPADLLALGLEATAATVPGNVELDLVRAGRLPEPFYAENMRGLRNLEANEWWYVRHFDFQADSLAPAGWRLVFEGLDTLATVWLNGACLGQSDNMLIAQRFEIPAALLRLGENELVVRIGSAVNFARAQAYDAVAMSWEHREEGLYLRKPGHMWGWDIMPRAVSAGIFRFIWNSVRRWRLIGFMPTRNRSPKHRPF